MEVQRNELDGDYTVDQRTSRLYPKMLSDLSKCTCSALSTIAGELISVQSMVVDIETNYDAIRVFGIRVDMNFLVLLKSSAGALVVGLGAALARQYVQ